MSSQSARPAIVRAHSRWWALFLGSVGIVLLYADAAWGVEYFVRDLGNTQNLLAVALVDGGGFAVFLAVGLYLTWCAFWLLTRQPALKITHEGIFDRVHPFPQVGFIPWEEIVEVRAHKFFQQRSLAIWLRDPDRFLRQKSALVRLYVSGMRYRGGIFEWGWDIPALELPWVAVAGDVDRLVDQIRAEYGDVLRAYGIVVRRDPRRERRAGWETG